MSEPRNETITAGDARYVEIGKDEMCRIVTEQGLAPECIHTVTFDEDGYITEVVTYAFTLRRLLGTQSVWIDYLKGKSNE